ncbi:MAG: hypothetical protein Pg6B_09380 [Candidatus Azobacteroides pseudotrichonymphae]|jgi:hypothetical protein|nr:MAG: hypothetical protein Pg6B_09380 [Candidatus Azobacteroides pseudotrichonymphae]
MTNKEILVIIGLVAFETKECTSFQDHIIIYDICKIFWNNKSGKSENYDECEDYEIYQVKYDAGDMTPVFVCIYIRKQVMNNLNIIII